MQIQPKRLFSGIFVVLAMGLSLVFSQPKYKKWVESLYWSSGRTLLEQRLFVPHPSLPIMTFAIFLEKGRLFLEVYKNQESQLISYQRLELPARRLGHFKFQGRPQQLQMIDQNGDGFGDLLIGLFPADGQGIIYEIPWNQQTSQFQVASSAHSPR